MASVDDVHHKRLQDDVIQHLLESGYLVDSAEYHAKMSEPASKRLARNRDICSIYIRGRADRIAISPLGATILEFKTNSGKYWNAAIEAYPLACHIIDAKYKMVDCVYVYRDIKDSDNGTPYEKAFRASHPPKIDRLIIPSVWKKSQVVRDFQDVFESVFPSVEIEWRNLTAGSNDPFCLISRDSLEEVGFDWRNEFPKLKAAA